jgi:hypothetical protein
MSTPTASELARKRAKRAELADNTERFLLDIKETRGDDAQLTIGESERLKRMQLDLRSMERSIADYEGELARVGELPGNLARRVNGGRVRGGRTAGQLSPLDPPTEELRRLFNAVQRGESAAYERRFTSADSLLPPELSRTPRRRFTRPDCSTVCPASASSCPASSTCGISARPARRGRWLRAP